MEDFKAVQGSSNKSRMEKKVSFKESEDDVFLLEGK